MSKLTFYDHISLRQYQVRPDVKNKFLDTILTDMEKQKDEVDPNLIEGLQVKSRVTHAGRLTGHYHYYGPAQVKAGADSFLKPFNKPILRHHDDHADPIGRVKSVVYVDTPPAFMTPSMVGSINQITKHSKKTLSYIKKMKPFLYDPHFQGLGYLETIGNITDADAIEKILDGRYYTISIGYDTDALFCSECLQDWATEGPCEHVKGMNYGNGKTFMVFGDMMYEEFSYVNKPADDLAANIEMKKVKIPKLVALGDYLKDSKKKSDRITKSMLAMSLDSEFVSDALRVPVTDLSFYKYDSVNENYISINNITGDTMKIKDLKNDVDLYTKVAEFIPEAQRFDADKITALKDSDFVGANRLFVAVDAVHIDAAKKFLEGVEDSDEKTELLSFLDTRKTSLEQPSNQSDEDSLSEDTTNLLTKLFNGEDLTDEEVDNLYEASFADDKDNADKKLSSESRKKLKASTFCGPNKSFPVPDCAHVTAAKRLLGRYKGEGDKSKILACVNRKAKSLKCGGGDEKDNLSVDWTFSVDQDMNVKLPASLCDEVRGALIKQLAGKDYIYYNFSISANGSPESIENNEPGDKDKEKMLLELLLSLYAKEKGDALTTIASLLAKLSDEDKNEIVTYIAKEKIDEAESRVNNFKNEEQIWNTEKDNLNATVISLSTELKDFYVTRLASLREQEDPNQTTEQLKDELKQQTLAELRASARNLEKIMGKDTFIMQRVNDDTHKYTGKDQTVKTLKLEDIDKLESELTTTYIELSRKNASFATKWFNDEKTKLKKLRDEISNPSNN